MRGNLDKMIKDKNLFLNSIKFYSLIFLILYFIYIVIRMIDIFYLKNFEQNLYAISIETSMLFGIIEWLLFLGLIPLGINVVIMKYSEVYDTIFEKTLDIRYIILDLYLELYVCILTTLFFCLMIQVDKLTLIFLVEILGFCVFFLYVLFVTRFTSYKSEMLRLSVLLGNLLLHLEILNDIAFSTMIYLVILLFFFSAVWPYVLGFSLNKTNYPESFRRILINIIIFVTVFKKTSLLIFVVTTVLSPSYMHYFLHLAPINIYIYLFILTTFSSYCNLIYLKLVLDPSFALHFLSAWPYEKRLVVATKLNLVFGKLFEGTNILNMGGGSWPVYNFFKIQETTYNLFAVILGDTYNKYKEKYFPSLELNEEQEKLFSVIEILLLFGPSTKFYSELTSVSICYSKHTECLGFSQFLNACKTDISDFETVYLPNKWQQLLVQSKEANIYVGDMAILNKYRSLFAYMFATTLIIKI